MSKKENGRKKNLNILRIKSVQKDPKTSESLIHFIDYTQFVFVMLIAQVNPDMRRFSSWEAITKIAH